VLLLDDCALVRASVGQALASFDLKIVTSANPFALSTLLRDEDPDLVLVDLGMPAIRGDKLIELARKDGLRVRPSCSSPEVRTRSSRGARRRVGRTGTCARGASRTRSPACCTG
jgi:DNA-binding NarL/FixJ family response regulator